MKTKISLRGVQIFKDYLDRSTQEELIAEIRKIVTKAPLFRPKTRSGKNMSVRMTSAGKYGWYSDTDGYRYETKHPAGTAWPKIPDRIAAIWSDVTGLERHPDCCLINFYDSDARMGMHQDRDEADFSWPVLSISLGDEALFRVGNEMKGGKTESIWLKSGDIALLDAETRLIHHGVDRIKANSSTLLPKGGRLNLTLRVVD